MKMLNLDKIADSAGREICIGGKTHSVPDMTVENYIVTTQKADEISADVSPAVQLQATIDMLLRSIPSLSHADLKGLSLFKLQTLVAYVRGDEEGNDGEDAKKETSAEAQAEGK